MEFIGHVCAFRSALSITNIFGFLFFPLFIVLCVLTFVLSFSVFYLGFQTVFYIYLSCLPLIKGIWVFRSVVYVEVMFACYFSHRSTEFVCCSLSEKMKTIMNGSQSLQSIYACFPYKSCTIQACTGSHQVTIPKSVFK